MTSIREQICADEPAEQGNATWGRQRPRFWKLTSTFCVLYEGNLFNFLYLFSLNYVSFTRETEISRVSYPGF